MVFINSKKFACESCIKGHRSSNCHHNDRPLFEIKKKGRPVSQCEKCREARQARRIHAKCTCEADRVGSASSSSSAQLGSKRGKRFIPTVPALPNGLKDALAPSSPTESGPSRSQVDALLNPCHCADVWNCKCRSQNRPDASGSRASNAVMISSPPFTNGLSALAAAAACCSPAPSRPVALPPLSHLSSEPSLQRRPSSSPHRHAKAARTSVSAPASSSSPSGSSLPPFTPPPAFEGHRHPPSFPRASTSTVTVSASSSMDDDCCCGHRCECEGCTKHDSQMVDSGSSAHRPSHPDACGHDCPTCIDHNGGIELPTPGQPRTSSFLDEFFARAASTLPSPPPQSGRSTSLDPTNVTVYPPGLFANGASSMDEQRGLAFGLVQVPKLECCGGKCSCAEGSCTCGDECGGCCT